MARYAIVKDGGRQYRLEPGEEVLVDRKKLDSGASIAFDEVLLLRHDDGVDVGRPTVEDARVEGTVVREEKGPKVVTFKFRRRKGSYRKQGHRQTYTRVRVDRMLKGDEEI